MGYVPLFLRALAWTCAWELPVLLAFRRWWRLEASVDRTVLTGLLASAATLPWVWFVFPEIIADWTMLIAASELFALGVEALVYALALSVSPPRAFMLSLVCNALSFMAGVLFGLP